MEGRKFYLNKDLICRMGDELNVCISNKNGTKLKDVVSGEIFQRGETDLPFSRLLALSDTYVYKNIEKWVSLNGRYGASGKQLSLIVNELAPIISKTIVSLEEIEKLKTMATQMRAENYAKITKTTETHSTYELTNKEREF